MDNFEKMLLAVKHFIQSLDVNNLELLKKIIENEITLKKIKN
jgi:hypothetical protein